MADTISTTRADTFGGSDSPQEMAKANVVKASTTSVGVSGNPFVDPVAEQMQAGEEAVFTLDATLAVGKGSSASLTLATDSLIVLGMFPYT